MITQCDSVDGEIQKLLDSIISSSVKILDDLDAKEYMEAVYKMIRIKTLFTKCLSFINVIEHDIFGDNSTGKKLYENGHRSKEIVFFFPPLNTDLN